MNDARSCLNFKTNSPLLEWLWVKSLFSSFICSHFFGCSYIRQKSDCILRDTSPRVPGQRCFGSMITVFLIRPEWWWDQIVRVELCTCCNASEWPCLCTSICCAWRRSPGQGIGCAWCIGSWNFLNERKWETSQQKSWCVILTKWENWKCERCAIHFVPFLYIPPPRPPVHLSFLTRACWIRWGHDWWFGKQTEKLGWICDFQNVWAA